MLISTLSWGWPYQLWPGAWIPTDTNRTRGRPAIYPISLAHHRPQLQPVLYQERERERERGKEEERLRKGGKERESMCVPVESSPPTERFDHRLDPLFFLFRRFLLFSANPPSALSLLSLCFICRNASNRQQRFTPTISARAHTDFLINARLCRAPGSITKLHRWRSPR